MAAFSVTSLYKANDGLGLGTMDVALVMFKENGQPKEFALDPGKTVIGRKEDCDLRIPLADISRRHAMMIVDAGAVTIRDLGSANGTYLNNKRITEHELSAGDHLVIGPVVFTVRINGEPSDVKPVHTKLETRPTVEPTAKAPARAAAKSEKAAAKHDDDPISALEALAASGDTAALGMEDSSFTGPGSDDSGAPA